MLSKIKIKFINSLENKKNRSKERLFVAEGAKLINELLVTHRAAMIVATTDRVDAYRSLAEEVIEVASIDEMKKISQLSTPASVLALFHQPDTEDITNVFEQKQLILALDSVQDPGNLGTIVRIADWFGIRHIVCSHGTADIYNPKSIQATMGALARVAVHYADLTTLLPQFASRQWYIYGTFLDGENIYHSSLNEYGVIVMGNEGNGISNAIEQYVTHRLLIPPYPTNADTVESLNVAIATAITCSEFRRRG